MEVDSPGNKRKNEEEYDELNISPTKQSKNNHLHQNNHHNNNNHGHVYNNNNNHHAHHQKPDGFYNSEDEEPQDFKTQNNNMDDYVGANADKVPFVLKPASPKKKSTWNDYRPGPPKKGKIPLPKGNKNCLAGKVFLITGILDSLERDEAAQLIEFYGGKVVTGIVLSLTHAVVGSLPGPKKQEDLKKLKDSGKIQILDQSELFELINNSPAISDEDAKQLNSPKKKGGSPSPKKKAPPSPKGKGTNKQGKDKTPPKQDKDNKDNKKDNNNNDSDGDDDNEKRKSKKDKTQREPCMYGVECYRKNFQHRQDFAHPGDADYKP